MWKIGHQIDYKKTLFTIGELKKDSELPCSSSAGNSLLGDSSVHHSARGCEWPGSAVSIDSGVTDKFYL